MVSLGTFQILKVMQHLRNVNSGSFSYCWTICLAIFIVTVILCCSKPPVLSPHKSLLCRLDQNNLSSLGFPFIDLNPSMTLEACIWPPAFSPSHFSSNFTSFYPIFACFAPDPNFLTDNQTTKRTPDDCCILHSDDTQLLTAMYWLNCKLLNETFPDYSI